MRYLKMFVKLQQLNFFSRKNSLIKNFDIINTICRQIVGTFGSLENSQYFSKQK